MVSSVSSKEPIVWLPGIWLNSQLGLENGEGVIDWGHLIYPPPPSSSNPERQVLYWPSWTYKERKLSAYMWQCLTTSLRTPFFLLILNPSHCSPRSQAPLLTSLSLAVLSSLPFLGHSSGQASHCPWHPWDKHSLLLIYYIQCLWPSSSLLPFSRSSMGRSFVCSFHCSITIA